MSMNNFIISSVGKNIINSLSSGILILDKDGKILLANNKAPSLYGFGDNKKYLMLDYHSIISQPIIQEVEKAFPIVMDGDTYRIDEIKIDYSEENSFYLGATLYPLYNEWGEVMGIIINGRDITRFILENEEKKQLTILNQKLNDILEKFKFQNKQLNLANTRNETIINTIIQTIASPINMLESGLASLEKKYKIDKESFEYTIMNESYQQLVKLKDQIVSLNYSETNEVKFTDFSLRELIREVMVIFNDRIDEKNMIIDYQWNYPEQKVQGNIDEIVTVLQYIIDNAICYSHNKGKITFSDEKWEGYYFLSISDNGIGIPENDLPNIFTPFYRGGNANDYHKGAGLSLTIAKTIIEKNHGAIRLESKPLEGAKVTFYLKTSDEK